MREKHVKNKQTLMSKKFFSMLFGGTLTMMVVSLLLMSDQIIAGLVIGSDAVAGITMVTPIYSLSAFIGAVISLGVPILYSTEMGKFNKERADQVFGLGVLMALVIGFFMFFAISLFGDAYLRSSSLKEEILLQATGYLSWMRFTILLMPMQMLIGAAVYYDGDELNSNIANIVQGVGNIIFSAILSQFMGIWGIGLASFLFNAISLLISLCHFLSKNNSLRMNLFFSFSLLKDVVRYSIVDSSSYLFLSLLTAALNYFVTSNYGSEYLILVSAVTLSREFQLLFEGIGEAVGPIFSVYVGEHNCEGLRSIYSLANKVAIIEGITVTIVMILIAPIVPGVLDVTRPDLVRWVVEGVRMTALGASFVSLLYLLTSYYLIIEQIMLGFVVCALRDVIFSVSLAFVLGGIWGLFGMFMGLAAAPAIAYAVLMLYITMRYGREDCPLLLSYLAEGDSCYLFNLSTESEEIISVQGKIESLLKEHNVDKRTINRVSVLIEEMYVFIRQMNENKVVLAECTVFLKADGVQIISKDDGVSFDMSDEDHSVRSLSAYTISQYLEKMDFGNRHLTTMSFNRSSFFIKYSEESNGKE